MGKLQFSGVAISGLPSVLLRRLWWWKIQALNESGKNLQGDLNWEEIEINCEF